MLVEQQQADATDTVSWSVHYLPAVVSQPFSTRELLRLSFDFPSTFLRAKLTARCHSGSCLDLPYIYSTEGTLKEPNLLADAGQGLLGAGMSYLR